MEAGDWIKWDDKLSILTGVSHSQTHSDGSVISIGYTMEYKTGKLELLFYRMEPNDHKNRKVIASVPIDKFYFMHALALSENYATVFLPPVYYKNMLAGMISGKVIQDLYTQDKEGSTKMIVVNLKTGEFKTIDSEAWLFVAHFSQSYETEDGELVVEVPITETADAAIDLFLRENYNQIDKMIALKKGSILKRCTFNFEKGTVDIKDLLKVQYGMVDLPQYNRNHSGSHAQYTYLTHVYAGQKYDETLTWPIIKYDDKLGGASA